MQNAISKTRLLTWIDRFFAKVDAIPARRILADSEQRAVVPLEEPTVPDDLEKRNFLERSVIALAYFMQSVEYFASPSGELRSIVRRFFRGFLAISIPSIFIIPFLLLVFWSLHSISEAILGIFVNLLLTLLTIIAIGIIGTLGLKVLSSMSSK
ncbi:hypothetical protein Ga0100231_008110 [Opitutaceae bacterium TAV4]|nr:hypothetical protein Ga0100231_008110 [Opitutaceae bacterium TAV4]RRJ98418.1 hypothetical protein Ga0100230_008410 [Opitutaceae bacterium TAV3]